MKIKWIIPLLVVGCVFLSLPIRAGSLTDGLERELGKLSGQDLEQQYSLCEDANLNARAKNLLLRQFDDSAQGSELAGKYWIGVLDTDEVNGFALPGRRIYLTRSLLENFNLDGELAFMLDHEITHCEKKHGLKGIVTFLISGSLTKENVASELVATILERGRSRDDERAADFGSLERMKATGQDKRGALAAMRRLETLGAKHPTYLQKLFMTHPPSEDRAAVIKDSYLADKYGSDYKTVAPPAAAPAAAGAGPAADPRDTIVLQQEVFHLGDDTSDSSVIWDEQFELTSAELTDRQSAYLTLEVKATPNKDPKICFNRKEIGCAVVKSQNWEKFRFSFSPAILRAGSNLIDLETLIPDFRSTFDDCEVRHVVLHLAGGASPTSPRSSQTHQQRAYPVLVHFHTTFSDGCDTIKQRAIKAKEHGFWAMIASDHLDLIAQRNKSFTIEACQGLNADCGLDDYLRQCENETSGGFITIPGAEVTAATIANGITNHSHTLAIGSIGYTTDDAGAKVCVYDELKKWDYMVKGKTGTQDEIIKTIDRYGLVSIAAHPALVSDKKFWVTDHLCYDMSEASCSGLNGSEWFNNEKPDQAKREMEIYCTRIAKKQYTAATAGCDSHTVLDEGDWLRWTRATWVAPTDFSLKGIVNAIRDGHTYAATNGARLSDLNCWPGKALVKTDKPTFKFKVEFSPLGNVSGPFDEATDLHKFMVVIYRDGQPLTSSVMLHSLGGKNYNYEWSDDTVTPGEHWYFILVDGYLVSSPYCYMVTK